MIVIIIFMHTNYFADIFVKFYNQFNQQKEEKNLTPEQMQNKIIDLLTEQERNFSFINGSFAQINCTQLQYMMCALVDEIMLTQNWEGKQWWSDHLLEYRLFKTRIAGHKVFEMIDQTLISGEQYQYALIPVYIYVLALGFKGKFNFEQKNEQELIEYKNKLFHCVYGKQAEKVAEHEGFDVHELNNTQGIVATQDLRIGKWLKVLFFTVFSYSIAAHTMWVYQTMWVSQLNHKILEQLGSL